MSWDLNAIMDPYKRIMVEPRLRTRCTNTGVVVIEDLDEEQRHWPTLEDRNEGQREEDTTAGQNERQD